MRALGFTEQEIVLMPSQKQPPPPTGKRAEVLKKLANMPPRERARLIELELQRRGLPKKC